MIVSKKGYIIAYNKGRIIITPPTSTVYKRKQRLNVTEMTIILRLVEMFLEEDKI